jgi:DNA polymerase-3 subunit alpha
VNYIPLNVKTSYFLLSSLNDIKKLITKCKAYNLKAIGITDPNLFGVFDFYKECIKAKIKPIIGLEIELEETKILLYAINYQGYQNLTKLLYEKQETKITIDILKKYNDNLICVLPFNASIYYKDLTNIYDYLYLGYANLKEREALVKISPNVLFVNEVLYFDEDDQIYLKYLYLIRDGKKVNDLDLYELLDNNYLLTNEKVKNNSVVDDIKKMETIYNLCEIKFPYNENLLPKYPIDINEHEYLKALCKKGLAKRLANKIKSNYVERLKYELDTIEKMGFSNYFLVVWDFVKYAKKNNILVGPGRGSAAGSLVSYCLGITDIDPIKYNLLFERFLNPERITMPDIDIDFESNRREEVVNYVIAKYGKKNAMPIITFVTLGGKQVIRDVGRIFDIDINAINQLSRLVNPHLSLTANLPNKKLQNLLAVNPELKRIYQISTKLEGLKRQFSVHAAGIVISNYELDSYIPMQKYNDIYITGISMEHLEDLGLLKIDFLGLKNLTLIENVLDLINNEINFNQIPFNDKKTLAIFQNGLTEGIFQFESIGMKNFIRRLKPNCFEEIVAAVALFRPGPMANIGHYIKRKYKQEKIDYLHPDLKPVLEPTYGIIVYQEQIMQIANIMAGYSLGEADVLRRAMSKKKREVLEQEQTKFIKQSIDKGYDEKTAIKVYKLILKFADYGFNRAHSVAYALIGYRMAYLKVHYPKYFISSLLTNALGNESKTKLYLTECKALGIPVLGPDINMSDYHYKSEELGIRFSLAAIKNVGGITCKEIIKERMKGEFTDFFNFVGRTYGIAVNNKTIETLIDAGCFRVFGYNQKTLHHNLKKAINYAEIYNKLDDSLIDKPIMEVVSEFDQDELIKREIICLGISLRSHPTTKYKTKIPNAIPTIDLSNYFDQMVNLIIKVEKIRVIKTKKGEEMAFISGSDEVGMVDIVMFPKIYSLYQNIKKDAIYLIFGKVEKRMSSYQLIASKIEKL